MTQGDRAKEKKTALQLGGEEEKVGRGWEADQAGNREMAENKVRTNLMDKEDTGPRKDTNSNHSPDSSIHTCEEGRRSQGQVTRRKHSPGMHSSYIWLKTGVSPVSLDSSRPSLLLAPVSVAAPNANGAPDTPSTAPPVPQP